VQESTARVVERPLALGIGERSYLQGRLFVSALLSLSVSAANLQHKISGQICDSATRNHQVCKESAGIFL
jgi:hypothetical protein